MTKYLLAHDIGTSGNKATLFTVDGKLVKSEVASYELFVSNTNWAEQNADDWWRAVCESTKRLVVDIDVSQIAAVSFSGQMMGCNCVDKAGKPLRNAIIWADMRAEKQEEYIRSHIDEQRYYHITGHRISCTYGGPKMMWIKENEPEVYRNTYKMLNAKDYIILKLTNQFVTEYTDASSTCLLDLSRLEWSEELLSICGIDREKLPILLRSTDIAGVITSEAAKLTGLNAGTPVVCGGGDGACAAVGTGCVKEGIANICMGTSSWISVTTKEPVFDEKMTTMTWPHIVPEYVLPCGTMQCGGGSLSWAVKELCQLEAQQADGTEKKQYARVQEETLESPVGANGLLFLPYLIGERSPRWDANARGAFIGLTLSSNHGDMIRAVMEGVALNLDIILQSFIHNKCNIERLVMVGGGARNKVWGQILADVFCIPIKNPALLILHL